MAVSNSDKPRWLEELDPRAGSLRPPAAADQIEAAERALECLLPADYREFLAIADGAAIRTAHFRVRLLPVSRSRGVGDNPADHDLVNYNTGAGRADDPFLVIGITHNPDEHVGFLKSDLKRRRASCPLYLEWHESGDYERWANSFGEFLAGVVKAGLTGDLSRLRRTVPHAGTT